MPHEYIVQEWLDGKAGDWKRISAAAKSKPQVTGTSLTTGGKLAEPRVRVRLVGKLSK